MNVPELKEIPFVTFSDLSLDLRKTLESDTTIKSVLSVFTEKKPDSVVYFVGVGHHEEAVIGRVRAKENGDYAAPDLVRMPGSELKERTTRELVAECIEDEAWDWESIWPPRENRN